MIQDINDNFFNNASNESIEKLSQQHAKLESYATRGYIYNVGAQLFNILRILWNVPFGSIKVKDLKNITFLWTRTRITQLIKKEVDELYKYQPGKAADKNFQAIAKIVDRTARQCLNKGQYKDLEETCNKINAISKILESAASTSPSPDTQKEEPIKPAEQNPQEPPQIPASTSPVVNQLPSQTSDQPIEIPKDEPETTQEKPIKVEYPENPETATPAPVIPSKPIKATVIKKGYVESLRGMSLSKVVLLGSLLLGSLLIGASFILRRNPLTVQPNFSNDNTILTKSKSSLLLDNPLPADFTIPSIETVILPPGYKPPLPAEPLIVVLPKPSLNNLNAESSSYLVSSAKAIGFLALGAIGILKGSEKIFPSLLQQAENYYQKKDYEKALKCYEAASKQHVSISSEKWLKLGKGFATTNDVLNAYQALRCYYKADCVKESEEKRTKHKAGYATKTRTKLTPGYETPGGVTASEEERTKIIEKLTEPSLEVIISRALNHPDSNDEFSQRLMARTTEHCLYVTSPPFRLTFGLWKQLRKDPNYLLNKLK